MKGFTLNKYKGLGLIMMMVLWAVSYRAIGNSVVLPSPLETAAAFAEIIGSAGFLLTLVNTLVRIFTSFLIALTLALILGIISALNQWFYDLLSPFISLFKIVPTMAIVILALIWLTNTKAPILIAVIIVLPLLYEAVIKGIRGVDGDLISMAGVYRVKTLDTIRYIYIPSILSNIGSILSSSMGLCLKIVIGAEVLGQPKHAIGTSIQTQKMYLNTSGVLGWIIILVILSLGIDMVAKIFIGTIKAIRKGLRDGQALC